jgi:hypothetical protein
VALLFRTGAARGVFRTGLVLGPSEGPGILDHLAGVLGRDVVASIALTPPRANRKPVLHVMDGHGRTVAFAKVGINQLTADLVRHETRVLRELAVAGLRVLRPPEVIDSGTWNGMPLLVLTPLPTHRMTEPDPSVLAAAMHELADVPAPRDVVVGAENYVRTLLDRAGSESAGLDLADRQALSDLVEHLTLLAADPAVPTIRMGAWHGDWAEWNCGQVGPQVLLWDWERYRPLAPKGFDALHYAAQHAVIGEGKARRQTAGWCLEAAPQLLHGWQETEEAARLTAALYLAEIALRYLLDGQRTAGGAGGDIRTWALPALQSLGSAPRQGRGVA